MIQGLARNFFVLLQAIADEENNIAHMMAARSADIIAEFAQEARKRMGIQYRHHVIWIWQMVVHALSTVEQLMSPEIWRCAKMMFCVEFCNKGYLNLSTRIFFWPVKAFPFDPERMIEAGTEPVPEWFANRVYAEFKSMDLNKPKYASNDTFYRAAWDCVRPMALLKQHKKNDKAWAGAKKKIQPVLHQAVAEERERIAKVVQAFVRLRAEYREHGALRAGNWVEDTAARMAIGMRAGRGHVEIQAMKQTAQNIPSTKPSSPETASVAKESTPSRKAQRREKVRRFLEEIVEGVVASVPAAAEHAQWVQGVAILVRYERGAWLPREEMRILLGLQAARLERSDARYQVLRGELVQTQAGLHQAREEGDASRRALVSAEERVEHQTAECRAWRREAESTGRLLHQTRHGLAVVGVGLAEEVRACLLEISAVATVLEKAEKDGEDDSGVCCVCMEATADHALVPCGHVCVCGPCVSKAGNQCPICRQDCRGAQAVFWACM